MWGVLFLLGLFCIHTSHSVGVFAERRLALLPLTQIVPRHQNATTIEGCHNHFYLPRLQDMARTHCCCYYCTSQVHTQLLYIIHLPIRSRLCVLIIQYRSLHLMGKYPSPLKQMSLPKRNSIYILFSRINRLGTY